MAIIGAIMFRLPHTNLVMEMIRFWLFFIQILEIILTFHFLLEVWHTIESYENCDVITNVQLKFSSGSKERGTGLYLCYSFAESCDLCYSFQILTIWIGIQMEIRL